MRISERQIFDGANYRSQLARTRMDEATAVASSGLRINSAEDDPAGAAFVTRAKADETQLQSFIDTLESSVDMTQAADLALGDAGTALQSLYELAVQMGNDTMNATDRRSALTPFDNMRSLLLENLNRQFNGRTLLAGSREDGPAFDPNSVPPGNYLGDTNLRSVETAPGVTQVVQQRVDLAVDDLAITFADPNNLFDSDGDGVPETPTPTQVSMFEALENLRVALTNNDAPTIRALIAPLSAYVGKIADTRAEAGAQQVSLEGAISVSTVVRDTTRESRSDVEDADSVEAFSELQFAQRSLEAALQASAKGFSLSLLDVVR
jgi:flagellin-like hook-associated protein FlgL